MKAISIRQPRAKYNSCNDPYMIITKTETIEADDMLWVVFEYAEELGLWETQAVSA